MAEPRPDRGPGRRRRERPRTADAGQPDRRRRVGHRHRAQPSTPDPAEGEGPLALSPLLDHLHLSGLRLKRAEVIGCYTDPPPGTTVICTDEMGPVILRTFPPAPGWSVGGHRIKAPLEYSRGLDKTWCTAACASAMASSSPSARPCVTATAGSGYFSRSPGLTDVARSWSSPTTCPAIPAGRSANGCCAICGSARCSSRSRPTG